MKELTLGTTTFAVGKDNKGKLAIFRVSGDYKFFVCSITGLKQAEEIFVAMTNVFALGETHRSREIKRLLAL